MLGIWVSTWVEFLASYRHLKLTYRTLISQAQSGKPQKTKERLGDYELHSSPRKKANESTTTTSTDSKLQRVHCYKKN